MGRALWRRIEEGREWGTGKGGDRKERMKCIYLPV